eukprot:TRINITY_DN845_c0_g1_i4.p1 TRINITY_DN845_c0_g1~~TRINITY_DN845_c0_g1_i4.p1  ORF type:complete len:122 (+),score=12.44 TRINITY_DN845_c0_g1_i4:104-469(+)
MVQADFVIAIVTGSDASVSGTVLDYYRPGTSEGMPCQDPVCVPAGTNDVTQISLTRDDTSTTAVFQRPLVTKDLTDDWPITEDDMHVIFAHGTSDVFGYHSSYRGLGLLNFYTGAYTPSSF